MKKGIFCFAFLSFLLMSIGNVPSAIAGGDEGFKGIGYVHSWYVSDDSTVGSTKIQNTFLVRRARLGVKGHSKIGVIPIKYKLLGDFADSGGSGGKAFLLDAYLDLNINKLFNVGMGQFKYHYMQIGTASSKIKAIGLLERPEISNNIHSNLATKGSVLRDIGIRIHGKQKGDFTFGYDLEIINGNGGNKAEVNDDKTIVVHLYGSMSNFTLFGAYFTGDEGTEGSTLNESGWTIGGKYKKGPIWIQAEYAAASLDQSSGLDKEPNGWYILGAYSITPEFQGVVRYDQADLNDNASNDTMDTFGVGVNYKVNKHATLSANYYIKDADSGYSEKTLLGRGGNTPVKGNAVGNVFLFQAEYVF